MAVLASKSEPKCKLCRHDRRAEIDTLLELRSDRTRDPETGKLLYTADVLIAQFAEWGVKNPTEENLKNHWQKHCQRISTEVVERANGVALAKIEEIRAGGQHADTDDNLRLVGSIWQAEVEQKLAQGEVPHVSTEHMLKAAAELTRRSASETQHQLLSMFVGATGSALKAIATGTAKHVQGEQVIDAIETTYTELSESALLGTTGREERMPPVASGPDADSESSEEVA